jgi:hypothetical protein
MPVDEGKTVTILVILSLKSGVRQKKPSSTVKDMFVV